MVFTFGGVNAVSCIRLALKGRALRLSDLGFEARVMYRSFVARGRLTANRRLAKPIDHADFIHTADVPTKACEDRAHVTILLERILSVNIQEKFLWQLGYQIRGKVGMTSRVESMVLDLNHQRIRCSVKPGKRFHGAIGSLKVPKLLLKR